MTGKRITATDTAKLVRMALKEAFPTWRFSVKTHKYSMGASINIEWTNGPTTKDVERVAGVFQGAGFDGMQDMKTYNRHTMDGEPVSFGADYIFCRRDTTDELVGEFKRAWASMPEEERVKTFRSLEADRALAPYQRPNSWSYDADLSDFGDSADDCFRAMARNLALVTPQPSVLADSVQLVSEG